MLYILNAPVLTSYGIFSYWPIPLEEARARLMEGPWESAVGHESTARFLSALLEIEIPARRTTIHMREGDEALIFRLKERLPEGKILSLEEMYQVQWEFGLLRRPNLSSMGGHEHCPCLEEIVR